MPQLDGLRGIAVLAVCIGHFAPGLVYHMPVQGWGVQVFFVLSGFLITRILLNMRSQWLDGSAKWLAIRNFYIRRALRILPLFFCVLTLGYIFNFPGIREGVAWHFSFLSNYYFYWKGELQFPIGHFWSLAVEEQFYLAWPFIIMLLSLRGSLVAILSTLLLASAFRYCYNPAAVPERLPSVLLPWSVDFLGMGAFLAWIFHTCDQSFRKNVMISLSCSAVLVLIGANYFKSLQFVSQNALAILFGGIVYGAACSLPGLTGRMLESIPLTYIGKISYGIYILHVPVAYVFYYLMYNGPFPGYRILTRIGISEAIWGNEYVAFIPLMTLTVVAASISWRWLESPFNRLKHHFPNAVPKCPADHLALRGAHFE